jgi:hypothetical protein
MTGICVFPKAVLPVIHYPSAGGRQRFVAGDCLHRSGIIASDGLDSKTRSNVRGGYEHGAQRPIRRVVRFPAHPRPNGEAHAALDAEPQAHSLSG